MKVFAPIVILSTILLAACGTQTDSELAGNKTKYRITCDIRVNQWSPGQASLLATVDTHVEGKKTYTEIAKAYADADEIFKVVTAADQKCSKDGVSKVNTSACGQIAANVNTTNIGRYNTFNINNGQSTGFYQCQAVVTK